MDAAQLSLAGLSSPPASQLDSRLSTLLISAQISFPWGSSLSNSSASPPLWVWPADEVSILYTKAVLQIHTHGSRFICRATGSWSSFFTRLWTPWGQEPCLFIHHHGPNTQHSAWHLTRLAKYFLKSQRESGREEGSRISYSRVLWSLGREFPVYAQVRMHFFLEERPLAFIRISEKILASPKLSITELLVSHQLKHLKQHVK